MGLRSIEYSISLPGIPTYFLAAIKVQMKGDRPTRAYNLMHSNGICSKRLIS
jgi:hypothetical protein